MAELVSQVEDNGLANAGGNNAVESVSYAADLVQVKARCFSDFNYYAALAMPDVMVSPLPPFYIAIWQLLVKAWVDNNKALAARIMRFALGLPRGHAKTTFIKALISWLIVHDYVTFVLILCANENLAKNILSDIDDILGSPNIEAVYGNWRDIKLKDTQELKQASYHRRPVVLAALGAGSSVRGLNIANARPDFILCDDVQTRENDESPTERMKLLRWLVSTAFKTIAPRGNRVICYIGNMYSEECILFQLKNNPAWVSMITGAILEDGEPLWPDLHSLEDLRESFIHDEALGLSSHWFAEIMNDPKAAATSLLTQPLPNCPWQGELYPDGAFITIDPAGFRKTSDDNVIVAHYIYDGKPLIAEIDNGKYNPEEVCRNAIKMAMKHHVSVIGIEAEGYQSTLGFWMKKIMQELQITGIEVVELRSHGRSKEKRITLFINECFSGNYFFLNHEARAKFVWQGNQYKIGKRDNRDDILDACAYGLDMRNEYWHLITLRKQEAISFGDSRVVGNNTPF